ncbi:MAG: NADH:flavin oxidoreductase [Candidatus Nealsonbacteria bacterium]|nr:NADH:flavin oxidoreductase [Candidatus Nealsonbacteria bacterium]
MPTPFDSGFLGSMAVKNRFVRSATWEGMADDDGSCSSRLVDLTRELAKGEVGLIISGHALVSPEGQTSPRQIAVYDGRFVPGLKQMTEAAHEGGSKIVAQLAHAGLQAVASLTQRDVVGPSSVTSEGRVLGRAMTPQQIEQTIQSFTRAAEWSQQAGFDGVQIHAAHGYLLSQFLSPHFNKRTDEYGGSIRNRARLVLAILEKIKAALGATFPVLIKMNSDDFIDGGLTVEEMLRISEMLEDAGIDGIELSGGTVDGAGRYNPARRGRLKSQRQEVYYREAAKRFKERIGVPLLLVGGIRSYTVAEDLIQKGMADYISLSRPFIREPHLIARWKSGDREKSACRCCNLCYKPIQDGEGMYCVTAARERERKSAAE